MFFGICVFIIIITTGKVSQGTSACASTHDFHGVGASQNQGNGIPKGSGRFEQRSEEAAEAEAEAQAEAEQQQQHSLRSFLRIVVVEVLPQHAVVLTLSPAVEAQLSICCGVASRKGTPGSRSQNVLLTTALYLGVHGSSSRMYCSEGNASSHTADVLYLASGTCACRRRCS